MPRDKIFAVKETMALVGSTLTKGIEENEFPGWDWDKYDLYQKFVKTPNEGWIARGGHNTWPVRHPYYQEYGVLRTCSQIASPQRVEEYQTGTSRNTILQLSVTLC